MIVAKYARTTTALLLMSVATWAAGLPDVGEEAKRVRAAEFQFTEHPFDQRVPATPRVVRVVHPSLRHIDGWISSVGASIALSDLDGDGLPNDGCHVDPRFDDVRMAPADATSRYAAFALPLDRLPYDARTMAPMGCLAGDFDEDGRTDALVYFWGRTPMVFLRRSDPLGAQAFDAHELVERSERWFTNAATRADLDGDGHADLVIANYFPDGARILAGDAAGDPQSMQDSMTRAANGGKKHFFLWAAAPPIDGRRSARFVEAVADVPDEMTRRWTLALAAADLDGDLRPELYFANDFGPDALLHNQSTPGHLRFTLLTGQRRWLTPASKTLGRDGFKGMGVDFGDLNRDAIPDIYVSNIAAEHALEESHFVFLSQGPITPGRAAPYSDASEDLGLSRSGWGWDAKLDDFDNDGELEAVQATGFVRGATPRWAELQELATGNDQLLPHPRAWPRFSSGDDLSGRDHTAFFARHADGRYYDVAAMVGLGGARVARGVAIADVDGDGRLDVAIANQWDQSYVYRNRSGRAGHFIGLHVLRPSDPTRPFAVTTGHPGDVADLSPAIGASVTVRRHGRLVGARQVDGGNGHSGRRSPDLHFGLGASPQPVEVEFHWRSTTGAPQRQSATLSPGWHVVVLGDASGAQP